MACPNCGCKETYQYDDADEDFCTGPDSCLERCAACHAVFDVEDHTPEDDGEAIPSPAPAPGGTDA